MPDSDDGESEDVNGKVGFAYHVRGEARTGSHRTCNCCLLLENIVGSIARVQLRFL